MLEFLKKRDNATLDALIEINNGRANWSYGRTWVMAD
jgi:hypothetical protein